MRVVDCPDLTQWGCAACGLGGDPVLVIIIFHDFRWSSFSTILDDHHLESDHLSSSFLLSWYWNQVEGGGEPFNHDQDYNKEVVMIMIIVIMMIKDKIMAIMMEYDGWFQLPSEKKRAWVTAMNEMKIFARFTSSWTEWPNKWDTGWALTYRSLQS